MSEQSLTAAPSTHAAGRDIAGSLIAGGLCSVLGITLAVSDASVMFQGALAEFIPVAVGLCLTGAAIVALVVGMLTRLPGSIGGAQDSMVIIIAATLATAEKAILSGSDSAQLLPTAVAIIALSSAAVGIGLWLSGYFRVGRLIRYVPYPVMAGFLAGSGLLLAWYSLSIITGSSVSPLAPDFYQSKNLIALAVAACVACALQFTNRESGSRYEMALVVVGSVILFHGVSLSIGLSTSELQQSGWMISDGGVKAVFPPITLSQLTLINWPVIWELVPQLLSLLVIATLGVLVKISALELVFKHEADQEHEMKVAGWSNIASAFASGMPGYHAVSFGQVSAKLNVYSRGSSVVVAIFLMTASVFANDILPLLPRAIFGGVALWLGAGLVIDYAIKSLTKVNRIESLAVLSISAVIALAGFLPGLICGIAFGVVLFAYEYSRQEVIRGIYNGTQLRSNVDRYPQEQQRLSDNAEASMAVRLHGYLFFGSTQRLIEQIGARVQSTPALKYLILDFDKVTGLDMTAVQSLRKLQVLSQRRKLEIWVTGASTEIANTLTLGRIMGERGFAQYSGQLDYALESVENALLGDNTAPSNLEKPPFALPENTQLRTLKAGESLLRLGTKCNELSIVQSGYFDVEIDGPKGNHRLRRCGPGSVIGEVSFYTASVASANVIAATDSAVWQFSHEQLHEFTQKQPVLAADLHRQLAATLAQRLSDSSRQIGTLV